LKTKSTIRFNTDNINWVNNLFGDDLLIEKMTQREKEAIGRLSSRAIDLFSWGEEDSKEAREAICQFAMAILMNKDKIRSASIRLRKLAKKKAEEYLQDNKTSTIRKRVVK
jgi:hypothetical protein